MKIFTFILLILSFSRVIVAQNISNYIFTAQSGTYTPLTSLNSTLAVLSSGSSNEGLYNNIPIGFDFFYLNTRHNSLSASTNGWLALTPGTITNSFAANNLSSTSAPTYLIAPLWDDLDLSSGSFRYQTSGTAPNRIFTAEWSNVEWNWNTNTPVISFQVKLFETSGNVQFEYKQEAGLVAGASASIGIRGSNGTNIIYQSLNGTSTSPTSSTSLSSNSLNAKPATGQIFRFANNAISAPTNLFINLITINSMRLNWVDGVSNESGYVVFRSTDNINFSFVELIAPNSTNYILTNLPSGTTFFYRVFALNEGRLSTALTGFATTLIGTLGGTLNVPGNYSTITAALNAIRSSGMASAITIQLNTTYNSSLETYPIDISNIGTSSTRILTIRPASNVTNLTISAPSNTSAFLIANSNFIILDGRPGGIGTNRVLDITCTSGKNTILFDGDCSNDTIRFCKLSLNDNSSSSFPLSSVISFASQNNFSLTGCNNNAILNNEIFGINSPSALVTFGVNVFSSNPAVSKNNTISNNILYDFLGNFPFYNSAVLIRGQVDSFTISNNNFFQTSSLSTISFSNTFTMNAINIYSNGVGNHTISNNIIGGGQPFALGNPWEVGPVSEPNVVIPIEVTVGSSSSMNINNNTIRNFFIGSSSGSLGSPIFTGIKFTSFGKSTNININNNNIGNDTGTNSITIINEANTNSQVIGIFAEAFDTSNITINNNKIGAFSMSGTSNNDGVSFSGIILSSAGTINGNLIGSLSNENSIRINSSATSSSQAIYGITNCSFPGFSRTTENYTINNNTISGLKNNFTASSTIDRIVGIDILDANSATIQNNLIQNLTVNNPSTTANSYTLKGINLINNNTANALGYNLTANTIRNLVNVSATGICNTAGIYFNTISNNTNTVSRNFIHSFNHNSQNNVSNLVGITLIEGDIKLINNMVRLGITAIGTSLTSPINISCFENNSSDNVDVWHNSFYIGGTLASSISNTYCIKRNSSSNMNIANNIMVNNRAFSASTIKRNYCIGIITNNLLTGIKNCYFYNGAGTSLAQIGASNFDSIIPWRAASTIDAESGRVNPNFINATGTQTTVDLHVSGATPIESNGAFIPSVLVDFDGQTRSLLTPNDIGADAGIFTSVTLPVKWQSFTAKLIIENVQLNFATAQEINNQAFVIERSTNGIDFEFVNTFKGKGNSNVVNRYVYNDNISNLNSNITTLYYRIKQVDFDGNFSYSTIEKVVLNNTAENENLTFYPNPFIDKVIVSGLTANTVNEIEIINTNGQTIKHLSITSAETEIDLADLPKGIYIISVTGNSNKIKLVKL
ncbi:MAG: T9SS type A sorting domain-containing protein [Candidatus Methylacidiphilales bacterium]